MGADLVSEGQTLRAAEKITQILVQAGIGSVLIGAAALAVHGYPRSTEDLDLATCVDPQKLDGIVSDLRSAGFTAELNKPDGNDPLGGLVQVSAEGIDLIEIVNFLNPPLGGFPALLEVAFRDAIPYKSGSLLRVVTLPHLVIFKLYAGGRRHKNDVLELLSRNPDVDLSELRDLCKGFRMDKKLESWLRELRESADD